MITAQTIITVVILYLVIINVVGYVIMGVDKKEPSGVPGASRRLLFFSRRFWVAVWDVFWECSTSVIRRSTGISSTECRRSWWYRYCFLPFYSNRKYAILLLYDVGVKSPRL